MKQALQILERAVDAYESAEYDLKGGFELTATNRAYYTCFYCMVAMLLTKGEYAKTHQGVRAKFSELFIKTKIFPESSSLDISLLFRKRQAADYDFESDITAAEAMILVEKAATFLHLTKDYFNHLSADTSDNS